MSSLRKRKHPVRAFRSGERNARYPSADDEKKTLLTPDFTPPIAHYIPAHAKILPAIDNRRQADRRHHIPAHANTPRPTKPTTIRTIIILAQIKISVFYIGRSDVAAISAHTMKCQNIGGACGTNKHVGITRIRAFSRQAFSKYACITAISYLPV